jgi:hypothetical protein
MSVRPAVFEGEGGWPNSCDADTACATVAYRAESSRTRRRLMHPDCPIDQVYLYRELIDFRKAINALGVLVRQELNLSPFASTL